MTIDGVAATTEAAFDVVNPATGAPEATAPDCTPQQLDAAMDSAAKAYRDWRRDEGRRRELLRQCADALMAAAEDVAPILTLEQGKPLGEATFEVYGAAIWFQYYADLEIPRQVIQDDDAAFVEVVQRPLGVVAGITPWNFPLVLASWKIAPALLARSEEHTSELQSLMRISYAVFCLQKKKKTSTLHTSTHRTV